jgi:hypothetical protein
MAVFTNFEGVNIWGKIVIFIDRKELMSKKTETQSKD